MDTAIVVAIISGIVTIITVLVSANSTRSQIQKDLEKSDAIQNERIENLRKEVEKHNKFAERLPVIEEQIKVANHRIDDLEHKVG